MSENDIAALIEEKNRVVRENWRFRGVAERVMQAVRGCSQPACNIGGGLCSDCGAKLATAHTELEELCRT